MAHIPEQQLTRLKQEISLQRVAESAGIAWGACQTGSSVIDWVMKADGFSFRHAVELLQNDNFSSLAVGSTAALSTPNP